jgi:short-subunit dehydrogenase
MSTHNDPSITERPTRPVALITGASAGIGAAFARELASRGYDLVLTARRQERLDALARNIETDSGCNTWTIAADLADPQAPALIMQQVTQHGLIIEALVNNAGYGVPGAYTSSDWETHQRFLQVMVLSIAELTHRCLPAMKKSACGRIINIASLAGLVPSSAGHTLYGAVKSWLIKFSEALSFELRNKGIVVTAVCPGFTHSEFHDVTGTREQASKMPNYMWMTAEVVAHQAIEASMRGENFIINGRVNRLIAWLARHLPRWLVYRLMATQVKQFRDER